MKPRLFSHHLAPLVTLGAVFALVAPTSAFAAPTPKPKPAPAPKISLVPTTPLPSPAPVSSKIARSAHAPFEMGECEVCHSPGKKKGRPGPIQGDIRELCVSCHEQLDAEIQSASHQHDAATENCVDCHNPHNSAQEGLLREPVPTLCLRCHEDLGESLAGPVTHDAMTSGDKCLTCHDPHAAEVENLLMGEPVDLCLSCHSETGLKDHEDHTLTNFKTLLASNPKRHGPVAKGDCSGCHEVHGGANFRLLAQPYPESFYAGFTPETYALCFRCHDSKAFTEVRTTTATSFRDGDVNLHYVHVHKSKRGRTCRACHEVHASSQDFHIRETVPYGSRGWLLHLNFEKRPHGGTCSKTCHTSRPYNNGKK